MPSNWSVYIVLFYVQIHTKLCLAWLPDTSTKLVISAHKIASISFKGSTRFADHFTVLHQDDYSLLVGGRNKVYNLSSFNFEPRNEFDINWPSSEAHSQLCIMKGKSEEECQNYLRLLFYTSPGKFMVCGTNSYKPLCRHYLNKNGKYIVEKEIDGIGLCPYNPDHNSTAVFTNGQLFSATLGDFSGGESLVYREPLRTEPYDLNLLNGPNFVNSIAYGDYVYFFFRETAVEFMNCGKIIYSRVARVCKYDKGGTHLSKERWTTFTKARLNCSVPGEYPFYFDEIQSTSPVIEGKYGRSSANVIYSVQTTPDNAIGGSAICMFQMTDIEDTFKGPFKHQETINSNWLPVPGNKIPEPRPGECARDSRILPDTNVNFIKTHPLMENAVPPLYGHPILIRVSLSYRFTAIAVDVQVRTVNDMTFDVIYVGTDNGKVLKVVNIPPEDGACCVKTIVLSENEVFSKPVKQLKTVPGYGKVVAVSDEEVKLVTLNHCGNMHKCSDCIDLRDPHCAWDPIKSACVSVDTAISFRYLIQDVRRGNVSRCRSQSIDELPYEIENNDIVSNDIMDEIKGTDLAQKNSLGSDDCNSLDGYPRVGCTVQKKLECTSVTFYVIVVFVAIGALFVGFLSGYFLSKKYHRQSDYPNSPFVEQHNHLERLNVSQNSFLSRPTKTVNLDVLNVANDSLPPKKENMGSVKNLNITNEGTLQKIKKTYI